MTTAARIISENVIVLINDQQIIQNTNVAPVLINYLQSDNNRKFMKPKNEYKIFYLFTRQMYKYKKKKKKRQITSSGIVRLEHPRLQPCSE